MKQATELDDRELLLGEKGQRKDYTGNVIYIVILNACLCGAFYGWNSIAQVYLMDTLGFAESTASALVAGLFFTNYSMALVGGFLADAYLGFYRLLVGGTAFIVFALVVLANVSALAPYYSAELFVPFMMTAAFMFIVGYGVAKPGLSAFMGDQFREDQSVERSKWFSWFYLSIQGGALGFSIATPLTLSYFPDAEWITFVIILFPAVIGLAFFLYPSSSYKKRVSGTNVFAQFFKIVWLGITKPRGYGETHWLDKAKRFGFSEQEVEDSKGVLSVTMIFVPLPFFWAVFFQMYSIWVVQASNMDLMIGNFNLPAGETMTLNGIMDIFLIPIFEKIIYPLCARCFNFTPLRRIGVGHIFTIAALLAAGFVSLEIEANPGKVSIFWIIPQYFLISCAEILLSITGLELAYKEAPASMKGMVTAIFMSTTAIGNLLISIFALLKQYPLWVRDFALAGVIFLVLILFTIIAHFYEYKVDPTEKEEK